MTDMPRRDSATQRAERRRWADTAEPRTCQACHTEYQPSHPRQLYCKQNGCSGRRPSTSRTNNLSATRLHTAARHVGVQGVLADVLLHTHHAELAGSIREVRAAVEQWVVAERTRHPREVHAALVRLQAACAVRTITVAPAPGPAEDADEAAA